MSLLSALTSLNPLSLVSNAVESACDTLLPKNLEFLGDVAGLAIDYASGNVAKCAEDVQDLVQDLPQQLTQLATHLGQSSIRGSGQLASGGVQPDPPPPFSSTLAQSIPTSFPATKRDPSRTEATTVRQPTSQNSADGSTQASNSSATTQSTGPEPVADPADSAPLTDAAKTNKATNVAKSTEKTDAASANAFFNLSDKDIMNALRDGTLPESVSKDPAQMQRLQLRMNDITQMNQLITSMIAALHDMNKQVIQNLHV
jgi:hypothetical protein